MLVELERRFFYSSVFAVPSRSTNSARYRACLSQLLFTPWDVSSAAGDAVPRSREKMTSWQLAFGFFNGDLMNEMRWEHWCTGCCSDEASSLAKAGHPMGQQSTLPNKTSFIFIPCFCKGGQPKIGVTACPSLLCPCRPRSCFPMPSSAAWSFTILNVGICAHLL